MNNYLASLVPALGNHLWQSTVFAAAAWVLTILLRKNSARVRYGIWLAASIKFLIPFSLLIVVGGLLPKPKQLVVPAVYTAIKATEQPFADVSPATTTSAVQAVTLTQRIAADIPAVLLGLWLAGGAAVLFVWWAGWRRASLCLHKTVPAAHGRVLDIFRKLERRFNVHLRPSVRLKLSEEQIEPSVYGILRPVLVWPQRLSERLNDEQVEAIIEHELAHARRFDNAATALHMLVEAAFWFHPMVWRMGRRMIEERERACDEAVLQSGCDAELYASGIIEVCKWCVAVPVACVSGISGSELNKRIDAIIKWRVECGLGLGRKLLLAAAALLLSVGPLAAGLFSPDDTAAQSEVKGAAKQQPSFEVASIKPSEPGAHGSTYAFAPGGGIRVTNGTVKGLIEMAYDVRDFQIFGGPGWVNSAQYDVIAKGPSEEESAKTNNSPANFTDARMSLQTLLADRFRLQVRREMKEQPIYVLKIAKGGPKLSSGDVSTSTAVPNGIRTECGQISQMTGTNTSMSNLALYLSRQMIRPVVDQTGLNGKYNFLLNWNPDFGPCSVKAADGAANSAVSLTDGPSLFTALQEQVGLKLGSTKGPVETIVIDHLEEPTPN